MNLERVQKYYELIDRELGIESNEFDSFDYDDELDLFGFESDEDDLFGFESDYDDELDLFGFESDEDNLFGTEGVKEWFGKAKDGARNVIKKSFAFVMNILRTIISAITTWWKNKQIDKLISLLKKTLWNENEAERLKLFEKIVVGDKDTKYLFAVMKACNSKKSLEGFEKVLENVKAVSVSDDDFENKMNVMSGFVNLTSFLLKSSGQNPDGLDSLGKQRVSFMNMYTGSVTVMDDEYINNIRKGLKTIMKAISIYYRKYIQFFQRKGETWFMNEADGKTLQTIKGSQNVVRMIISGANNMLKKAIKDVKAEAKSGKESIMSDIQDMMVANESLNDIIFDMEMEI